VTVKIIYLNFLVSYTSEITQIIWIFRVLDLFKSSIVFYLGLGSVLGKKLVLYLNLKILSIFFIVKY
jgi:hypothetical protein